MWPKSCPKNAQKMLPARTWDYLNTFFLFFLPNKLPKAAAPFFGGGRRPPPRFGKNWKKNHISMVPGPGWDHCLTTFWAHLLGRPRTIKRPCLDRAFCGIRKRFFHQFPGFIQNPVGRARSPYKTRQFQIHGDWTCARVCSAMAGHSGGRP